MYTPDQAHIYGGGTPPQIFGTPYKNNPPLSIQHKTGKGNGGPHCFIILLLFDLI